MICAEIDVNAPLPLDELLDVAASVDDKFCDENWTVERLVGMCQRNYSPLQHIVVDGNYCASVASLQRASQPTHKVTKSTEEPTELPTATNTRPGSFERLEVLRRRFESNQQLWHPDDDNSNPMPSALRTMGTKIDDNTIDRIRHLKANESLTDEQVAERMRVSAPTVRNFTQDIADVDTHTPWILHHERRCLDLLREGVSLSRAMELTHVTYVDRIRTKIGAGPDDDLLTAYLRYLRIEQPKSSQIIFDDRSNRKNFRDLKNLVFGRLTIIAYVGHRKRGKLQRAPMWLCRCSCGREKVIMQSSILIGDSRSCGCFHREVITTHGESGGKSKEYGAWQYVRTFKETAHLWPTYEYFLSIVGRCPWPTGILTMIDRSLWCVPGNMKWAEERFRHRADYTSRRFGHLTAVSLDGIDGKRARWLFLCDCGAEVVMEVSKVRQSKTASCGCQGPHGLTGSPEYKSWNNMDRRKVCERWRNFEHFIEDMGKRPSDQYRFVRIDKTKGFSPENCEWRIRNRKGSEE